MKETYRQWLEQHLHDAEKEYKRIQGLDDNNDEDRDLYERVHQMWGYLAGLEKCLKELKSHSKAKSPPEKELK